MIPAMLRPLDPAKVLFAIGILLAGNEAFAASGPSFDCRVASTKAEKAICADGELARTDAALAVSYLEALRRVAVHRRVPKASGSTARGAWRIGDAGAELIE